MKQLNSAKTYLLTAFSKIQTNVANISKPVTIECYETQFGMDLDTDFYLFGDDLNRINSATSDKLRIKVAVQIIRVHYLHLSTIFSSMPQNLAENTYVWFGGFYIHQGPNWARCWNDEVDLGGKPNLLCSDKTEIVNVPHFVMPPNIYEIVIKTLQQCQTLRYDLYNKIELYVPQFVSDGVIHQHCPGVSIKSVRKNWKNPFKTDSDHVVQLKQIIF